MSLSICFCPEKARRHPQKRAPRPWSMPLPTLAPTCSQQMACVGLHLPLLLLLQRHELPRDHQAQPGQVRKTPLQAASVPRALVGRGWAVGLRVTYWAGKAKDSLTQRLIHPHTCLEATSWPGPTQRKALHFCPHSSQQNFTGKEKNRDFRKRFRDLPSTLSLDPSPLCPLLAPTSIKRRSRLAERAGTVAFATLIRAAMHALV